VRIQDLASYWSEFTPFAQSSLQGTNPVIAGGLCLSLVGAWTERIWGLGCDSAGVPRENASSRFAALANDLPRIRTHQHLYRGRNDLVNAGLSRANQLDQYADIIGVHGATAGDDEMTHAALALKQMVIQVQAMAASLYAQVPTTTVHDHIIRLMFAYRLQIPQGRDYTLTGANHEVIKLAMSVVDTLFEKRTFWLITNGSHAIGAYRTAGMFHTDVYFYDPNYGEIRASGSNRAMILFGLLRLNQATSYKFYQLVRT